jgi:hypothetical protein
MSRCLLPGRPMAPRLASGRLFVPGRTDHVGQDTYITPSDQLPEMLTSSGSWQRKEAKRNSEEGGPIE